MNSPTAIALFRLVHIVAGVFWVGGVVFLTGFLLPTLRVVGPAAGQSWRSSPRCGGCPST
jgi:uncharacterized membrane protein